MAESPAAPSRPGRLSDGGWPLLAAVLLLAAPAAGRLSPWEVRGYAKEHAALSGVRAPDWLSAARWRTRLRWCPTFSVTAGIDAELAATAGPLMGTAGASPVPAGDRQELVDLTWAAVTEPERRVAATIDRAFVQYYSTRLTATAGRQRIAWGVSRYFRPLDVFAPFAPAQVDKEERAGIDALRGRWTCGRLTDLEVVCHPGAASREVRLGIRGRTTRWGWDLAAAAGRLAGGESLGASLAGSVGGLGVHGEGLVTHGGNRIWMVAGPAGAPDTLRSGDWATRLTVGAEYGFGWRNLTLSGELHLNGPGRTDPEAYDWQGLASGRRTVLGQHLAALHVSLLSTPLLSWSAGLLANADDGSVLLQPLVRYSLSQQLGLTAGAQLAMGGRRSEYGGLPDGAFTILAWHY